MSSVSVSTYLGYYKRVLKYELNRPKDVTLSIDAHTLHNIFAAFPVVAVCLDIDSLSREMYLVMCECGGQVPRSRKCPRTPQQWHGAAQPVCAAPGPGPGPSSLHCHGGHSSGASVVAAIMRVNCAVSFIWRTQGAAVTRL